MDIYPVLETYPDYETALKQCGKAYEDRELAEVTLSKTLSILERDLKVVLYPPNTEATLTALSLVAGHEPRILDFGGSFGSHFYLAKQCLPKRYRWAVVETELVASLSTQLANKELQFFTSIEAALGWLGEADLVHASGSLQCTPHPKSALESLVGIRAPVLAITRTAIALGPECITTQKFMLSGYDPISGLPDGIPDRMLTLPRIFMAQQDFMTTLEPFYRVVSHTLDDREGPLVAGGTNVCLGDNFVFLRRDL
jgi:putative methyltransferase (TIGR04325 family)